MTRRILPTMWILGILAALCSCSGEPEGPDEVTRAFLKAARRHDESAAMKHVLSSRREAMAATIAIEIPKLPKGLELEVTKNDGKRATVAIAGSKWKIILAYQDDRWWVMR